MSQVEQQNTIEFGIPSPGILLARRRQEFGWSTREVASALRLSERQIVAIEQDDYDQLPGKTYVMGYWKSYAQLLKLPLEESIQVHRANLSAQSEELFLEPSHKQVRGNEEKSRKRAAVLFGFLLAAFLGAIWYWQDPDASFNHWIDLGMDRISGDSVTAEEGLANGDVEFETPGEVLVQVIDELEQTESVLALPVPNFSEGQESVDINTRGYEVLVAKYPLSSSNLVYQQPEDIESDSTALSDITEVDGVQTVSQADSDANSTEPVASAQPAPQPSVQPAAQPVVVAQPVVSSSDSRIAFKVDKESWVDVRDSSGERLIYRTVNRGEDIQLTGIPPYSVFIGSAEGVVVQYQGKEVPFKVHESGLFARFEVGNP